MPNRREFVQQAALLGLAANASLALSNNHVISRRIGRSKESVPAIGMGTWRTFDVGGQAHAVGKRIEILRRFFEMGGKMIDSSPMYGTSQVVIGQCLAAFEKERDTEKPTPFTATKVWTPGRSFGIRQMKNSADLWGLQRFDLMQVHNLLDWETHLETLQQWRADGKVRYIGVTTSHGRRHNKLETIMREIPIDFVQLTYNIVDRQVEQRLLPLALERGISVIANRPLRGSLLFDRARGKPLPPWAAEFDCHNWAQYFLKYIISHRAVTCAIPATSRLEHMTENMGAVSGALPSPKHRRQMVAFYQDL